MQRPTRRLVAEGTHGAIRYVYSVVVTLLVSWAAIRFLGAEQYGVYVAAFLIVSGIALFGEFGFGQSLIPLTQKLIRAGTFSAVPRLIGSALLISFLTTCVLAGGVLALRAKLAIWLGGDAFRTVLPLLAPMALFTAWRGVLCGFLGATDRIRNVFSVNLVVLRTASLICIGGLLGLKLAGLIEGRLTQLAVTVCAVEGGVLVWMFVRYRPWQIAGSGADHRPAEAVSIPSLLSASGPIAMHRLGNSATSYLDKLLVAFLSARVVNVGLLYLAGMLSAMLCIPHTLLTRSFGPMASSLYQEGKLDTLAGLYKKTALLSTMMALALGMGLALWAPLLLPFYGESFSACGAPLSLLILAQLITVGTGPCGYTLMMIGRTRILAVNTILAILLTVLLGLVLIPRWGIVGAACATLLVAMVQNFLFAWKLYQHTRIHPFCGEFRSLLVEGGLAAGVALMLRSWMPPLSGAICGTLLFGSWCGLQLSTYLRRAGLTSMRFSRAKP